MHLPFWHFVSETTAVGKRKSMWRSLHRPGLLPTTWPLVFTSRPTADSSMQLLWMYRPMPAGLPTTCKSISVTMDNCPHFFMPTGWQPGCGIACAGKKQNEPSIILNDNCQHYLQATSPGCYQHCFWQARRHLSSSSGRRFRSLSNIKSKMAAGPVKMDQNEMSMPHWRCCTFYAFAIALHETLSLQNILTRVLLNWPPEKRITHFPAPAQIGHFRLSTPILSGPSR